MATKRQIEAYEKRLAKIDSTGDLTAECIGAVVAVFVAPYGKDDYLEGTLTEFTHRLGLGLLGQSLLTDVVLYTACAHQRGDCDASDAKVAIKGAVFRSI